MCLNSTGLAVLQLVAAIFCYIVVGCLAYSFLEDWRGLDIVYFCVVTMSTVGYGSEGLEPSSTGSRLFTCFYIAVGIFIVFVHASALAHTIAYWSTVKVELALLESRKSKERLLAGATRDEERHSLFEQELGVANWWQYYGVNVGVYTVLLLLFVCLSAAIFCYTEHERGHSGLGHLSYFDAIYFCWITVTSLGYGDSEITTDASRIWCIFYIILGCGFFGTVAAHFTSLREKRAVQLRHARVLSQRLDQDFIDKLSDVSNSTSVRGLKSETSKGGRASPELARHDRLSFLVTMLIHLRLAPEVDILKILDYFDAMDKNGDGKLTVAEIQAEWLRIEDFRIAEEGAAARASAPPPIAAAPPNAR